MLNPFLKRLFDILLSFFVILFLIPFWLIIIFLIKMDSSGPAFYLHTRVGKNSKEFTCFKFRTMKVDSDPNKLAGSKEDDRITPLGHFLRKTSLDETPQLINVEQKLKLSVKPGLTGWTQVNGRNSIPYEKRMELDCWYARHHNIFLDLWIIVRTFKVLFFSDGIYDPNSNSPVK
jgi:lipopolysaccharide/colanic/teichoic acid biosynthesis glycosyltransferase